MNVTLLKIFLHMRVCRKQAPCALRRLGRHVANVISFRHLIAWLSKKNKKPRRVTTEVTL